MLRISSHIILGLLTAPAALAQDSAPYPNQAIRIIVSVPAGGGVDTITRVVAEKLRQHFNQPVIVENRGGQSAISGPRPSMRPRPTATPCWRRSRRP